VEVLGMAEGMATGVMAAAMGLADSKRSNLSSTRHCPFLRDSSSSILLIQDGLAGSRYARQTSSNARLRCNLKRLVTHTG
jgi:hypothetical protein